MVKKLILLFCLAFAIPTMAKDVRTMKNVKVVVPYVAGGGPDSIFRVFQKYGLKRGINFIPEYKPGAQGLIGAEYASTQPNDGSTLMLSVVADLLQKHPAKKIDHTNFEPIAAICSAHLHLVAHPDVPANNLTELIALLKRNPQAESIIASTQSQQEILAKTFSYHGIKSEDLLILNYNLPRGLAAVMGGHVDIGLWPSGLIKSAVDSKRVKVLAAYKRNDLIDRGKNLEVMTELSKFTKVDGYGIFLPRGASPAVVNYWTAFIDDFKKDAEANQDYLNQECSVYKNPGRKDLINIIKTSIVSQNKFDLTFRQQQIADLIVNRGLTNLQIAETLKITEGTVKLHTGILFKKVGVQTRTQLAAASFNIG